MLVATRLHPVQRLKGQVCQGDFICKASDRIIEWSASQHWLDSARYFGWYTQPLDERKPVDWHRDPFTGQRGPLVDWWKIPDFDGTHRDIKSVWEASRFDWVLAMAERSSAGVHGESVRLNRWLNDWCEKNPPFVGTNWKCGQEAAIRVLHLGVAALILRQHQEPTHALASLVHLHLRRIVPTISYAIGQDNNHGTSEAAALLVGGSLLLQHGDVDGKRYVDLGRQLLENRVLALIEPDGTFSQYSVNYQRMVVDTLSVVERWRQSLLLDPFSGEFYDRARRASEWLFAMVEPETGDAPNIGANDGTQLLQLGNVQYRDYRPSVQLAMALFAKRRAYEGDNGENVYLDLMGVPVPHLVSTLPSTAQFDDGGFAVMRRGGWMCVLRYPRFRFRPNQADALHVDLWLKGSNILRDAGTFSYSRADFALDAFQGVAGHNSVQFDARDQMPRIGRFLFGNWPKSQKVSRIQEGAGASEVSAGYRDWLGAEHERRLTLRKNGLTVEDRLSGFKNRAVLRWRLLPGDWEVEGLTIREKERKLALTVAGTMQIEKVDLIVREESRYYLQRTPVPVLEATVANPGKITTEVTAYGP